MTELREILCDKNLKRGYDILLELEARSERSEELYACFPLFLEMLESPKSFIRVRGFRMICAVAKWDRDGLVEKHLPRILSALEDEKPTSVRQCLAKLPKLLESQPQLAKEICDKLHSLDLTVYKESMQPLLRKDIEKLLQGPVTLRDYEQTDCGELAQLFYDTVHTVNAMDYTQEQLDAWATGDVDLEKWNASFLAHHTVVAEVSGRIVGFGDMVESGYLDRLYVHKDFQRRGVATAICDALEKYSAATEFTTHASITARPFFEKRGYVVVRKQQVERRGVWFTNFAMRKRVVNSP